MADKATYSLHKQFAQICYYACVKGLTAVETAVGKPAWQIVQTIYLQTLSTFFFVNFINSLCNLELLVWWNKPNLTWLLNENRTFEILHKLNA